MKEAGKETNYSGCLYEVWLAQFPPPYLCVPHSRVMGRRSIAVQTEGTGTGGVDLNEVCNKVCTSNCPIIGYGGNDYDDIRKHEYFMICSV